jgi:GxxExxY protein
MELKELSFEIRGCIFEVFKNLGPGLLESVYEHALLHEIRLKMIPVVPQVPLPVFYKETQLDLGFRIDLLVDDRILVEVKSVESLHDVHKKQLLTYLKLSRRKVGLLINLNFARIEDKISLIRIIN